ncbi:YbaB/EbfC family nucleoid-associated protein [Streptosporangium sandarakinum]|uniref:YbaB/EbfC family nucleoid-associated protein n=1 Tax=Streptosporangium sandarakinum TaxID=1260955 RepID=UPI0034280BCA
MRDIKAFAEGRRNDAGGLLREADGWARAMAGALGELEEERLAGTDPSEVVRAEVSGTGRLRGLSIDPRRLRDLDGDRLARAVLEAIGAAHLAMEERLAQTVQDVTGQAPGVADAEGAADPLDGHIRDVLRGG